MRIHREEAPPQVVVDQPQHALLVELVQQGEGHVRLVLREGRHQLSRQPVALLSVQLAEALTELQELLMPHLLRV